MHRHTENKFQILLNRGVENIFPNREFLETKLKLGEPLTVYTGIDPTAPTLHIGNAVTLMKLRDFQELGHKIIFLIGNFTAMIGDPTDKMAARTKLTQEEVMENCKRYKEQASTILKFDGENPAEMRFNNDWLGKLTFADVLELSSHFTVQQMLERDMFAKRYRGIIHCPFCDNEFTQPHSTLTEGNIPSGGMNFANTTVCGKCGKTLREMIDGGSKEKLLQMFTLPKPIYLHEFLYPLMQGYDSVAMDVDGEVGGNDQTFNMLSGRDLMKELKGKEKFVLATKLLVDSSGKKMGKTEGNMIAFSDTPEDMFGKVMRFTDEMIVPGFEICTRVPMHEVKAMEEEMKLGANPRDFKLSLAYHITQMFLGDEAARRGRDNFAKVIQQNEKPVEIPEVKPSAYDIVTVLVEAGFSSSKTDARRQIEGAGVKLNDEKVETFDREVKSGDLVQKGKRFFVKIR